ncbi:MAG: type II toxin-antitoxin system VapC family toxin [Bacteroidales bacterium]|nr:type II toxin-antitoxin system VapC family toxin [Bacteroidales bacterium]
MNGVNFLIDTNIIIYLTQGKLKINDFAKQGGNLYISSISYMETLGYPFQNQDEEKDVTALCEIFERIFLTKEIEKQTILIRKSNKIKLPDAIIAATAMVYNLTLVTHNRDDFKNIQGLQIINPFL